MTSAPATRATRLLIWAVVAALVLSYVLLVLSPLGQQWDDAIFVKRRSEPHVLARELNRGLHWINPLTWLLMAVVVLVTAAARRCLRRGIVAAGVFAATILLAEVLKIALPRPGVGIDAVLGLEVKEIDTWPSGHTASATAFVLALILIVAAVAVPWTVVIGTGLIITVGAGVVLAGWHRPSDIIGGSALALLVFLTATVRVWPPSPETPHRSRHRWLAPASALMTGVIVLVIALDSASVIPLAVAMAAFAFWAAITTVEWSRAVRP